ncbi:hypothetical protein [Aminobacter aminovorans]|uniref:hypothetical protein n=1 Tax=Aminobacter aminovorans TaxID=83263 RepID=UPI00285E20D8|nr:hypothetical protein [Aminobacter aminovorans]MDR7222453.1 hypothetical protein [Aminobacter aminovorans]
MIDVRSWTAMVKEMLMRLHRLQVESERFWGRLGRNSNGSGVGEAAGVHLTRVFPMVGKPTASAKSASRNLTFT